MQTDRLPKFPVELAFSGSLPIFAAIRRALIGSRRVHLPVASILLG